MIEGVAFIGIRFEERFALRVRETDGRKPLARRAYAPERRPPSERG
jgi:hypothetical protein